MGSSQNGRGGQKSQCARVWRQHGRRGESYHCTFHWRSQCKHGVACSLFPQNVIFERVYFYLTVHQSPQRDWTSLNIHFGLLQPSYRLKVKVVDHDRFSSNDDVDEFDVTVVATKQAQSRHFTQRTV